MTKSKKVTSTASGQVVTKEKKNGVVKKKNMKVKDTTAVFGKAIKEEIKHPNVTTKVENVFKKNTLVKNDAKPAKNTSELTIMDRIKSIAEGKSIVPKHKTQEFQDECIAYLKQWNADRASWKFHKGKQLWLINNMLDVSKVPKSDFQVLVDYLNGAKGNAKQRAIDAAMKVVEARETASDGATKPTNQQYNRARTVIQNLQDA